MSAQARGRKSASTSNNCFARLAGQGARALHAECKAHRLGGKTMRHRESDGSLAAVGEWRKDHLRLVVSEDITRCCHSARPRSTHGPWETDGDEGGTPDLKSAVERLSIETCMRRCFAFPRCVELIIERSKIGRPAFGCVERNVNLQSNKGWLALQQDEWNEPIRWIKAFDGFDYESRRLSGRERKSVPSYALTVKGKGPFLDHIMPLLASYMRPADLVALSAASHALRRIACNWKTCALLLFSESAKPHLIARLQRYLEASRRANLSGLLCYPVPGDIDVQIQSHSIASYSDHAQFVWKCAAFFYLRVLIRASGGAISERGDHHSTTLTPSPSHLDSLVRATNIPIIEFERIGGTPWPQHPREEYGSRSASVEPVSSDQVGSELEMGEQSCASRHRVLGRPALRVDTSLSDSENSEDAEDSEDPVPPCIVFEWDQGISASKDLQRYTLSAPQLSPQYRKSHRAKKGKSKKKAQRRIVSDAT